MATTTSLIFLLVALTGHWPLTEAVTVAKFQSDGAYSTESYMMKRAKLRSSADLTDFSVCIRLRLQHLRSTYTYVVSYAFGDEDNALHIGEFNMLKGESLLIICPHVVYVFVHHCVHNTATVMTLFM